MVDGVKAGLCTIACVLTNHKPFAFFLTSMARDVCACLFTLVNACDVACTSSALARDCLLEFPRASHKSFEFALLRYRSLGSLIDERVQERLRSNSSSQRYASKDPGTVPSHGSTSSK